MAVKSYSIDILKYENCHLQLQPQELIHILKSWRNGHETSPSCLTCEKVFKYANYNFVTCCNKFYYKPSICYIPQSIAVKTDGYEFLLPTLKKTITSKEINVDQEFLIIPDPIYWQVPSTLVYDKTMKLVTNTPMTKKSKQILPPSKAKLFYKQIQEAPLNHGSLFKRSGGKNTFFRQIAFGKRVVFSMRATIVPDSDLKPNQVTLPEKLQETFKNVMGKWVIVNRMPSLQPENFVALKVVKMWPCYAIGLNLEIIEAINGDFDGDEINIYIIQNLQSQAEAEIILNSEYNMGSCTLGLKLSPCQDMKIAYFLFPEKTSSILTIISGKKDKRKMTLKQIFKIIFDLYDSQKTFNCFDEMRKFYLDSLQNNIAFGISLSEIQRLEKLACNNSFEDFEKILNNNLKDGCLVSQVKAGAKGSFYHLYQMFGSIGENGENSFWRGIESIESMDHILKSYDGLLKSSNIWQPGYGYSKSVYNLQSLHVDYRGRLVDGNVVIEKDVLDALYYTDLMSEDAFAELIQREMI